mgnify:CR=1 FL=1
MDEFDHALMEALNEAVPSADFATDLAGRLVKRRRRRSHLWRLLFVLGLVSAATAAVTVAMVFSDDADVRQETAGETARLMPTVTGTGDLVVDTVETTKQGTTNQKQKGESKVNISALKAAAAMSGALALAAASPSAALAESGSGGGYQFIVSGYPAANPSHSDVSSGPSLAVGALGDVSAAAALEARTRTSGDSAGTELRSDEFKAMIIIIK